MMGNEQSAPAPRGHQGPRNKLSKPRTNSSTNTSTSNYKGSAIASRPNSQSEHVEIPSNRYSSISVDAVASEAGEKQREPRRKRTSMFRSKSAQPKVLQLDIVSGVNIEYIESPKGGWSRRHSAIEDAGEHRHYGVPVQSVRPPIRVARMSLQHAPYSQHHPRLSLVPEAPTPQPDLTQQREQFGQLQRSQSVQPGENNKLQLSNPLSTRTQSETQLYMPIRRRSLLQHGVATRNSYIEENDSRQSTPTRPYSQSDLQNYHYNLTRPISPLAAFPNLHAPRPVESAPGPRVVTPNELDYRQIGAYKLGSLRITNGTVSPTPSVERPSTTGGGDDYITAGDDRPNASDHRHGLSQRSNTIGVPPEMVKPPWVTQKRAESPLRKEYVDEKTSQSMTIDTHLPLPEFSLFKFTDERTDSPTKSLDLARGYMKNLALSPFSFEESPPPSPRLEATSKHMAVEDDLFEAESTTPSTPEVSESGRKHDSFDSGYRGSTSTPKEEKKLIGPRELAPKQIAKADSGYSSNVSLRSLKEDRPPSFPAEEAPPIPPKPARSISSTYSEASSLYSTQSNMTLRPKRSLPALPVEEDISAEPQRQPPPLPQKSIVLDSENVTNPPSLPHPSPEQSWAASHARPKVIVKVHPKHGRSQSIPNVLSISRLAREGHKPSHGPTESEVFTSTASSGSTSRWRSRSRSSSRPFVPPPEPVFTVQAFRTSSEQLNIPPVSSQVSKSLGERVDAFSVACFPNTVRGNNLMRRTPSKETLGTIFSVGSAEFREELTCSRLQSKLPAVPAVESISEIPTPRPDSFGRHTYQPFVSQIPERKPIRQSLPPVPRDKPALQRKLQEDFETEITSFDSISSSLGKSPYEIALSPSMAAKQRQKERAKSMTAQFEADAAARFARARAVSAESQRLHHTTSYGSISNQNSWVGGSAGSSRISSKEYPPRAPSNENGRAQSMIPPQRSDPSLRAEESKEEKKRSFTSMGSTRVKSPLPVSMQTEHGGHIVVPTSRTPQPQSQAHLPASPPNRTPPQPPALIAHESEKEVHDPWAKQRDIWAKRKQEALHPKKRMENMQGRKGMGNAQSRKSFDIQRRPVASQPSFDHSGPRPESARLSTEYHHPQTLHHHTSSNTPQAWHPHMPGQQSYGYGYSGPSQEWARDGVVKGYDHTYGSDVDDKGNPPFSSHRQQGGEEDYYDSPSQDSQDYQLQRSVLRDSTSDLLTLDRGLGLGLGYEPPFGLLSRQSVES